MTDRKEPPGSGDPQGHREGQPATDDEVREAGENR